MIETSTINQESLKGDKKQGEIIMETINQTELDFYIGIVPALNNLIKSPSDEVVNRILAYSSSFKNDH